MEKYEGKNFIVYCGDALELMPTIAPPVDAIICDLPYGTTACKWDVVIPFEPLWKEYKRLIKERGAVVLFGSQPFTTDLINSNRDWFRYLWYWNKEKGGNFAIAKTQPMKVMEDIIVFVHGVGIYNPQMQKAQIVNERPRFNSYEARRGTMNTISSGRFRVSDTHDESLRFPINRLDYPSTTKEVNNLNRLHPTQKPVDLLAYLVKTYTNEGEVVLDNCMGSGSCGVACLRTGRRFIGIEKDEKYFATALERLQREEDKVESGLFANIENVKASETQQPLFSETVTYAYHTDGYAKTQVEVVGAGD